MTKNQQLQDAIQIILDHKVDQLQALRYEFENDKTNENLHEEIARISLVCEELEYDLFL